MGGRQGGHGPSGLWAVRAPQQSWHRGDSLTCSHTRSGPRLQTGELPTWDGGWRVAPLPVCAERERLTTL